MPLAWRSLYRIPISNTHFYLVNGGFPIDEDNPVFVGRGISGGPVYNSNGEVVGIANSLFLENVDGQKVLGLRIAPVRP